MKKIFKNNVGITLIALVITIIVLLILSGVTISTLVGENGILKQAVTAKETTESKAKEELNKLAQLANLANINANQKTSLYIWSLSSVDYNHLIMQINYLKINTIYLSTSRELAGSSTFAKMVDFCAINGIDLYLLDGDLDWAQDDEKYHITNLIDRVDRYNNSGVNTKVKGVNLDVEFYLTDEYKNATTDEEKAELFKQYVTVMKEQATYAKSKNLEYVVCLPVWLETIDESLLEELFASENISIEFMNYVKKHSISNIEKEVELAKKYNKNISTIAELGNSSGIPEEQTFYNDGIDACVQKQQEILSHYSYKNLGKSYHHYEPIDELSGKLIDFDNVYELDLYPYFNSTSVNIKNVYLVSGEQKIKGIPSFISSSNEYILNFYGLEYGKTYEIYIESDIYTVNQTINNTKPAEGDQKEHDTLRLTKEYSYTLEIYGYLDDELISLEGGVLTNDEETIKGKTSEVDGVNILIFKNLSYDKEYTLTIDNEGYDLQENKYIYSDKSDDYHGNHVILVKK